MQLSSLGIHDLFLAYLVLGCLFLLAYLVLASFTFSAVVVELLLVLCEIDVEAQYLWRVLKNKC